MDKDAGNQSTDSSDSNSLNRPLAELFQVSIPLLDPHLGGMNQSYAGKEDVSPNLFAQDPLSPVSPWMNSLPLEPEPPNLNIQPLDTKSVSSDDRPESVKRKRNSSPGVRALRSESHGPPNPSDLNPLVSSRIELKNHGYIVVSEEDGSILAEPPTDVSIRRKACDVCNSRKLRCQGGLPCTRCFKGGNVCRHPALLIEKEATKRSSRGGSLPRVSSRSSTTSSMTFSDRNRQISKQATDSSTQFALSNPTSPQATSPPPASINLPQLSSQNLPARDFLVSLLSQPVLQSLTQDVTSITSSPWQDELQMQENQRLEQLRWAQINAQLAAHLSSSPRIGNSPLPPNLGPLPPSDEQKK